MEEAAFMAQDVFYEGECYLVVCFVTLLLLRLGLLFLPVIVPLLEMVRTRKCRLLSFVFVRC